MPVDAKDMMIETGDHVVHFYDRDVALVGVVSAYLAAALQGDDIAVVIATDDHRQAFEAELAANGVDVEGCRARGMLVSLDATAAVSRLLRDGRIDRQAFDTEVGDVLRTAAGRGRGLHVYGEMVALLWDAGHVGAALELETLWSLLGHELPFCLLCVYPAASVSAPDHAAGFDEVCQLHTAVLPAAAPDAEAPANTRSLRVYESRQFASRLEAPRAARRFAVATLTEWGHHALVDDAALVLTELATNAVLHARSPFRVTLSAAPGAVRISVHDASPFLPTPRHAGLTAQSGRGLALVAAVAGCWGAEPTPDGKVVWAELCP